MNEETKRAVLVAVATATATALATAAVKGIEAVAKPLWREFGPSRLTKTKEGE